MSILFSLLGKTGIMLFVGGIIFATVYKNSVNLFEWIENHTFGTRDYIIEQLERIFIKVEPKKITILLLSISFGLALLVILVFGLLVSFELGIILGIVLGFVGWRIPRPAVDYLVKRRMGIYEGQMVDALGLMSNGIRAGLSIPQCLSMVADELPAPVSEEFRLMLQENKIGVPLNECFDNLLKRIPVPDNEMFVTAVNILRETGGNLAETFDTIVDVIRERVKVKQKIESFITQGKMQGIVIFCMPFGMGAVYTVSDPESMARVFSHPLGIAMIAGAFILNLTGGYVIYKIIQIDV